MTVFAHVLSCNFRVGSVVLWDGGHHLSFCCADEPAASVRSAADGGTCSRWTVRIGTWEPDGRRWKEDELRLLSRTLTDCLQLIVHQ